MILDLHTALQIESATSHCERTIHAFTELPTEFRQEIIDGFQSRGKEGGFGTGFNYQMARGMFEILKHIHERQSESEWIVIDDEIDMARELAQTAHENEIEGEKHWFKTVHEATRAVYNRFNNMLYDALSHHRMDDDGGPPLSETTDVPNVFEKQEPIEHDDPLVTPFIKTMYDAYRKGAIYGRAGILPIEGRIPTDEELLILQRMVGSKVKVMGVVKRDKDGGISGL